MVISPKGVNYLETAKVAYWMNKKRIKQSEICEKTGISRAYFSQILSGKRPGSVKAWQKIADALGIELKELC